VFQYLEPLWHKPLHHFTKESLVKLRRDRWKKERGRRFVNYIVTVLKIVFVHGVNENHIESNPLLEVQPIRRGKTEERLNRRWGDDERLAVWNAIKYPLKLPYALAVCYGVREGDMPSIPRSVIKAGLIKIRTRKRGVWIEMPIMPEVQEAWEDHRAEELRTRGPTFDSVVLCTSSRGTKWTENGFRASFFKFLKRLEAAGEIRTGCTYHGLRHSVASDIAEHEGTVEDDINAVLGQRKSESARVYIEEANRTRRAHATVVKLDPFKRKS
jgi:integrase